MVDPNMNNDGSRAVQRNRRREQSEAEIDIQSLTSLEDADLRRQHEGASSANRTSTTSARQHDFLADRKISRAEMQRRRSWLQRTRYSIAAIRNRCRLIHEVRFPETFKGLYCARFSKNAEVIAASFGTGGIQIRNGETGELKSTVRSGMESSFPVMCCRFNPIKKEIFYASSACGNIFMCTTDTNELTRFITESNNQVNAVDVSISGEHLVSGGKDAAVRIYDAQTAKLILTYQKTKSDLTDENVAKFHRMRIYAARFHTSYPDLILTGGWDDTVKIWDIRVGGGSIRVIKGPHICGDAIDIRENNVLTGSWVVRESLQLWDVMSGKLIETVIPRNRPAGIVGEFPYAVQYFDGDPYGEHVVVGGSGTGALEVISLKDKMVLGSFSVKKPIVTVDSCRTTILFGGMDPVLRLADYS